MAQAVSELRHQSIQIFSPATNAKVGEVAINSPAEVKAAVAVARQAQAAWRALSFQQRRNVMLNARDAILAHQEELIELLCAENGKPRIEALTEIAYVCDVMTFYGKQTRKFLAPHRITPHLLKNKTITVHYQPRGVIGMVTPWNFPLILTLGESIPALMA